MAVARSRTANPRHKDVSAHLVLAATARVGRYYLALAALTLGCM